jgi:hypothetical protein
MKDHGSPKKKHELARASEDGHTFSEVYKGTKYANAINISLDASKIDLPDHRDPS